MPDLEDENIQHPDKRSENRSEQIPDRLCELCPADGAALDSILEGKAGDWELSAASASAALDASGHDDVHAAGQSASDLADNADNIDPQRKERLLKLLGVLSRLPTAEPPADLASRTIERVRESRQRERFATQIAALAPPTNAFRMGDLLSVAAAILIAASLAVPLLARNQDQARQLACASHQAMAGRAVGQYAMANDQALPRGPFKQNSAWFHVGTNPDTSDGTFRSNSAHFRILIRGRFLHPNTLNCPSNADALTKPDFEAVDWPNHKAISYSYQSQHTPQIIRVDRDPRMPVIADKNPLFRIRIGPHSKHFKLEFRRSAGVEAPSEQHGPLAGQNVLTADGGVTWKIRPLADSGDLMWVTRSDPENYKGNEIPTDDSDAFLIP
jgi:hypothetical protein